MTENAQQLLIFGAEALLAASLLLLLYRLRFHFGLSPLYVVVGVFQPIQTLLASSVYVQFAEGLLISPGSAVMFSASLFAILLVYIQHDAVEARKIIYGIIVGNVSIYLLLPIVGLQLELANTLNFLAIPPAVFNQVAAINLIGTLTLLADVVLIIFVYEALGRLVTKLFLRVFLTLAVILTFDTVVFATGAFYGEPSYGSIVVSGIVGKLSASAFFAAVLTLYLYVFERGEKAATPVSQPFRDIFHALTYREKYELEKQRAERALLEGEAIYRELANSITDIFFATTNDLTITFWNKATERISGIAADQAIGKYLYDVYPASKSAVADKLHADTLATREPQTGIQEFEFDGRRFFFETTVYPSTNGLSVFMRNITERKNLEAQLHAAQKMEAVGQLTAGIAHDFNNLLTTINGFAELIKLELPQNDPLRWMLDDISSSGKHAAGLVRQLLTFSRKQFVELENLSLNEVLERIDKLLLRVVGESIELRIDRGSGLWQVRADPAQIEQIIMNLAVNARDAMPAGGKLQIGTANVTLDDTYVAGQFKISPGDYVCLTVVDNGQGMESKLQARIFEPFFTTKARGRGTGLGLANVYGIVKQNRGDISVQSEPGSGTTFTIHLPRTDETEPHARVQDTTVEVAAAGKETVLVVEDTDGVRKLASRVLRSEGYLTLEARNGAEALRLVGERPDAVDLLLTDVVMPGLSGPALADELSRIWPDIKVLYMSGYSDDAIASHGVAMATPAFLQKPFDPHGLAAKVREVLDVEH